MSGATTRRAWLGSALLTPLLRAASPAAELSWDGDTLYAAPKWRFLSGRPLQRLKDGSTVNFVSQFSLTFDGSTSPAIRSVDRFVISYDIWEEKFSVSWFGKGRRTASRLSAAAAEAFCFECLMLDIASVPRDRLFRIKLDMRAEEPRAEAPVVGEPGIDLKRLVEVFSQPPEARQPHWSLEAGPFRLGDLKRQARGGRIG